MGQKFTYTFELDAEIEKLQTKLGAAQKVLAGVMQSGKAPGIEKSITSIEKAIGRLQEKASTPITSEAAFGSLQKESSAIGLKLKELTKQIGGLANLSKSERFELLPADTQKRVSDAAAAIATFTTARDKAAKKSDELLSKERALSRVTKEKGDLEAKIAKNSTIQKTAEDSAKAISREIVQLQARQKELGSEEDALRRVEAARKAAEAAKASGASPAEVSFESGLGDAQRHLEAVREVAAALMDKEQAQKAATATAEKYSKTIQQDQVRLQGLTASYEGLEKEVKDLEAAMKSGSSKQQTAAWKELRQAAQDLGVSMDGIPVRRSQKAIDELLSRLNALEEDGYKELEIAIQQYTNEVQEVVTANEQASTSIARGNEEFREQKQIMADRNAFAQRIKDFVGLKGAAMLARTALRSAMQSVKELDAAMTEMSVVTDLSVGDYWEQLPEYTERASALGLSIKDAYEAATLFYQQGLKTNEVVAISNETLKMARIAGLSAEDATNKMTAALRGFNMELNETSAQKVSDVYSELAAITASDVNEISTAMTKTASIAANAGMEFETTAAFLSQIIETTRESAETAGTAMKTVIARFQELKKDPAEIGEVDGEIVDANKIETALRSVGVALRDSSGQFRDLDDVFLELSSKWNTLDTNTQRYIATIAAGSRQQSRFIAMMSDYGRTQELVNAANNSSGASNRQFEKTLESLESKLNQLKNSWDTFTMGILNNEAIKFGVDVLTKLLNVINKVTEGFGGFSGTVSKLGFVFMAFKIGQKLVQKFSNHVLGLFQQIGASWRGELNNIKQDTNNAINEIQNKKSAAQNNPAIAKDGHYKGFRERIFEPIHQGTAIKKTQQSANKAILSAEEGTGVKQAIAGKTISGGARNGSSLQGYAFNETFSPAVIKDFKDQFKAALASVEPDIKKVEAAWEQLEAEIGDMEPVAAIDKIESKMKEMGSSTASISVTKDTQAAAQEPVKKQPGLLSRTASAIKESVSGTTSGIAKARNAGKASRAIASARGGKDTLATTIKATFEGKKVSFDQVFDTKSLETLKSQFVAKMKTMKASEEDIEKAWEQVEAKIKSNQDINAVFDTMDAQLEQVKNKANEAGGAFSGMDAKMENTADTASALGEETAESTKASLESVSSAISNVGGAAMGIGSAFGMIGEIFRSLGLDAIADGFDAVAKVLMFVGSALMIIPPIITVINVALSTPPLGIILLIIGAIVVGLLLIGSIIAGLVKKNSAAEKLKEAAEAAEKAKENAEEAKQALADLLEAKSKYDSALEAVNSLTEGTQAWKNAVMELNEQVLTLLENYPELAKFISWENGKMVISEEGWQNYVDSQKKKASSAQILSLERQKDYIETEGSHLDSDKDKYTAALSETLSEADKELVKKVYDMYIAYGADSMKYQEAMGKLAKSVEGYGDETKEAFANFKNYYKEQSTHDAKIDNLNHAILTYAGSSEAQTSENYTRIVDAVSGSYLSSESEAFTTALEKAPESMYNTSGDAPAQKVKDLLNENGLQSTGSEAYDMGKLLAHLGGENYTKEEIDDMGSGADDRLQNELVEAYQAQFSGKLIDEIYNLQKSNAELGALFSMDLDAEITNQKELVQLATDLGASDNAQTVINNYWLEWKQARDDIDLRIKQIYKSGKTTAKALAGSYKQAQKILNMYDRMKSGAGLEMATLFSQAIADLSFDDQELFLNKYDNVNWSSAIDGAAALNQMIEEGNRINEKNGTVLDEASTRMGVFARATLEAEAAFYSATSQANEMYKSLGQDAIAELAQDGKIAATEILELAKSNEKLAKMLDNTEISAATLGTYFELLEDGTLNVNSATDDFIRVLEKLNQASNTIEDSFGFIDTWEPSRSSTEISTTFGEMRDSMLELYNIGAFGDQALIDYISAFIGADNWEAILNDHAGNIQAAMQQVMNQVKDFGTNFQAVWQNLANSGALTGVSTNSDGTINFDFGLIESTEALRQQIIDAGWSKEMADALIADAQTFGQNVKEGLAALDVEEAFIDWLSTSVKDINGKKVIDEAQFEAFIKESGMDPTIARRAIENVYGDVKIEIKSALNESGGLADWVEEAIKDSMESTNVFDIGATYQLLLELGLDDATARAQLDELANGMKDVEFTLNGQTVKKAGEELGNMSYDYTKYPTISGLMEAVGDPMVDAANKKAALDQATQTGKAMAAASVAAANTGPVAFGQFMDKAINGVINALNKIPGVNIGNVDITGKILDGVNADIDRAGLIIDNYFQDDYDEVNSILNGSSGISSDIAQQIFDKIEQDGGLYEPDDGNSYVDPDDIKSPTMDGEENDYETPYDWLFVLNQDLEDLIRKREKLERKYQKLLENENASFQDIVNAREDMLTSLANEREQQEKIITDSIAHSNETWKELPAGLQAWLEFDPETGEVSVIDGYEDADIDADTREKWDEFIAELIENEETIHSAQDAIEDLDDTAEELAEEGREESSDYFNRIKEALVAQRQEEIDALSAINDSVQEAQDALYNQIQKSIDEERQARENDKTEEEISDKEARLAYLRRDTSGANALEIASLEKELAEQKEDYRDSLIDQALTNLQDANAEAAEQREKQIALLEAQLEAYQNSDELWTDVAAIFATSMEMIAGGADFGSTPMGELLRKYEVDNENINPYEVEDWEKENKTNSSKSAVYFQENPSSVADAPVQAGSQFESAETLANPKTIASGALTHHTDEITGERFIYDGRGVYLKESDATVNDEGDYTWPKGTPYYRRKFLHGGLADFTGPAWLDGTKSSPELVLNAQDTHNFILLKDILSDILNGTSTLKKQEADSGKGGDNYYDIEINVDNISEDYDVEQLADKIKSMIYEDSVYRNVNTINLIR